MNPLMLLLQIAVTVLIFGTAIWLGALIVVPLAGVTFLQGLGIGVFPTIVSLIIAAMMGEL